MNALKAKRPLGSMMRQGWVLALLFVIYAINLLDRQIMAVLQEAIKLDLGLSDTELALMTGLSFAIFYSVMGLPIAWLADRHPRTWIISISCAVWSLFTALCGQAQNFATLALARIGVGIGEAGGVAPAYALLADYFPPKQRGMAYGVMTLGIPVGVALGTALGATIAHSYGWRAAFMAAALPGLVIAVVFRLTVREPKRGQFDDDSEIASPPSTNILSTLKGFKDNAALRWLFIASALASIPSQSFMHWFPSFLQRSHGMSLEQVGHYYAPVLGLGVMCGTFLGGILADRLANTYPKAYIWVPAGALFLAIPFSLITLAIPSWSIALLSAFIPFALATAWMAPVLAALQSLTRQDERATASAFLLFLNNLIGMGLGTLFVGVFGDLFTPILGDQALRLALGLILLALPFAGWSFLKAAKHTPTPKKI
ncbi:spinster family MFS transporter [Woodsholea maritima]|uniref:spinster family MFS transporter n=1 Tax=Woodsholea maritima TaxID=240237 RepID=UPI0003816FC2|nr:MFS transporter [Woodsholea maritima]